MRRGLHLAVLSTFALAQPLFDLLARNPEFFATRGSTGLDVVAFAFALTVLPPALLLLLELLVGLVDRRLGTALHLCFVAALAAAIVLQALKRLSGGGYGLVALAAVAGVVAALAYWRSRPLATFLDFLGPAPAVFLALFLLFSPVVRLSDAGEARAATVRVEARTPVLVLVLDELPAISLMDREGRIDAERYPNFAALARRSTWFPNATTVYDSTTSAVPAILSGKDPRTGLLPIAADHPDNLFTLLGRDYRVRASEPVTRLCPERICPDQSRDSFTHRMGTLGSDVSVVYEHVLLPDDLRSSLPPISNSWGNFKASKREAFDAVDAGRVASFERRLAELSASRGGRTLDFEHLMMPHGPWQFLPSGRRYGTATERIPGLVGERSFSDRWLSLQAHQRHLLQVGFVDRLLGRLVERLRSKGLWERSLVVVTSDHGITFEPGAQRRVVSESNVGELAGVPLFVKAPRQERGRVDESFVRTTDIVPTIADLVGARLPWRADGRSVLDPAVERRRTVELLERDGDRLVVGARAYERRRGAALRRKHELFGSGRSAPGLYGIGPHPELIGRRLRDLRLAAGGGARAQLDDRGLRAVDPRSEYVPSHITGRIVRDRPSAGRDLAIAVNGRVAAVARSSMLGGKERFSALVPESALRAGANDVSVLSVHEGPGGLRLATLGRSRAGA